MFIENPFILQFRELDVEGRPLIVSVLFININNRLRTIKIVELCVALQIFVVLRDWRIFTAVKRLRVRHTLFQGALSTKIDKQFSFTENIIIYIHFAVKMLSPLFANELYELGAKHINRFLKN